MHLSSYIPSLLYWFSFFSFHSLKWNGMTLCRVWSTIVFCLIVTKLWVFFLKTIICQYLKITVTARVWAFLDKFCKKNWLKLTNSTPLKVFVLEPSTVSIIFFEPWFWVTKSVDTYHQLMLLLLLHLDCFINYWHLIGHRRSLSLKISSPRLDSFMIDPMKELLQILTILSQEIWKIRSMTNSYKFISLKTNIRRNRKSEYYYIFNNWITGSVGFSGKHTLTYIFLKDLLGNNKWENMRKEV